MVRSNSSITLVERLGRHASERPDKVAYRFLANSGAIARELSFRELDLQARVVAATLQLYNARGERVLLVLPPGAEFIVSFWACLYVGAVAVPVVPPNPAQAATFDRLIALIADSRPALALTSSALLPGMNTAAASAPVLGGVRWIATDTIDAAAGDAWAPDAPDGDAIAFIQYTSGSTSRPRGVCVSHDNLLFNVELMQRASGHDADSIGVSWLPLYHDMGLIGMGVQPALCGGTLVLMSPLSFLKHPMRWLQAISEVGAAFSGAPNFAYEMCAKRATPAEIATLDLSSWRVAFCGAEPIRAESLQQFSRAFASAGFRHEAFRCAYGLAEATLMVTAGKPDRAPATFTADVQALEAGRAIPTAIGEHARVLVGCGQAPDGQRVVIADPETRRALAPDEIGEIWVSGPSVAHGYWQRPDETERAFRAFLESGQGPFLRTGDLGFIHAGELFVTGRIKDLIIVRGRNLYSEDIERTVERCHPRVRRSGCAAFSADFAGEERLVVVAELERVADGEAGGPASVIADAIRRGVTEAHDVRPQDIVLVRAGRIPKTTSGKIQRYLCRARYLERSLELVD